MKVVPVFKLALPLSNGIKECCQFLIRDAGIARVLPINNTIAQQ